MRIKSGRVLVLGIGLLLWTCLPSLADERHGYSGMTKIDKNTFLVVADLKHGIEHDPRLAILTVRTIAEIEGEQERTSVRIPAVHHEPLRIQGLPKDPATSKQIPLPSDLESCCAVQNTPNEYLLAESGFYKGNYGRVFHVLVEKKNGRWHATYRGHFQPFPAPGGGGTTPKPLQIEGMESFRLPSGACILVFGLRGQTTKDGKWTPASLVWGDVAFNANGCATKFTKRANVELKHTPKLVRDRGCSALHLRTRTHPWRLWTVATYDGGDIGPFRSVIYQAGTFDVDSAGQLAFVAAPAPDALWRVRGLKVEGLAGPAQAVPGTAVSIATECESYGGVWRPLEQLSPAPK